MFIVDKNNNFDKFIIDKMKQLKKNEYTEDDFILYKLIKHENVLYYNNGEFIAFCVIILDVIPKMAYTWCDGTTKGKRAYAEGIDYVLARYNRLAFGVGALKVNKTRRILECADKQ